VARESSDNHEVVPQQRGVGVYVFAAVADDDAASDMHQRRRRLFVTDVDVL